MKTLYSPIALLIFSATTYGFGVNPMVAEFDPNAPRSQQTFVLENRSDMDTPVEIVVARPTTGENSQEILEEGKGEDLFLILPQQLVLPANSKRSVKVLYVGNPMDQEETYRILFKELPVDVSESVENLAEGESSFTMRVVMQYHTRVWLTPSGLKEDLKVTNFKKVSVSTPKTKYANGTQTGEPEALDMLELTIANDGNKHGYIRYPTITMVKVAGKPVVLDRQDIDTISGQVIFQKSEKTFRIPWKQEYPELASLKEIRLETVRR